MDRQILNFTANEQTLIVENPIRISTNKVNYIEAHFALGDNWSGYDSVRAVWFNDYQTISTVLDSQGVCRVPFEVMKRKGQVKVDLVGSISENDVLTDRLTSYPVVAVIVDCVAPITGAETSPITPSQFEQFVANVRADANRAEAGAEAAETSADEASASATASAQSATASANSASQAQTYAQNAEISATDAETAKEDAENARDEIRAMRATADTLPAGSDATASYSDGLLTLGIPRGAKGDKGDKGDTGATPNLSIGTVETLPPTGSSEVTITGTAENPVLNFKLVKGDTGEVTMAQLAQLLPTDTASGSIASWTDGTDVFPAVSVLTTIEPIQSGSGTPSPDNVRPISGHTECVTSVSGVNVWDEEWEVGSINPTTGEKFVDNNRIRTKNKVPIMPSTQYYLQIANPDKLRIYFYDADNTYLSAETLAGVARQVITTPSNARYLMFIVYSGSYGNTYKNDISINYPSTDHEYHAYEGHQYTTNLGRTVYGGSLDVVSGVLTVTDANIASYNGETLPSTWISDRDVYSSGTTPTTGAQVVYKLSSPQTYQLTPTEVQLLLGTNNLWTDCGSVNVTYKADTYLWVEKQLGQ